MKLSHTFLSCALIMYLAVPALAGPPKPLTLEDLAKQLTRIESRLYRVQLREHRQRAAIKATNSCWKTCNKLFPWEDENSGLTKEELRERNERRKMCSDACPLMPDDIATGC